MVSGEQNIQQPGLEILLLSLHLYGVSVSKTDETGDYNRGHSRARVEEIWTPLNSCE